MAIADVGGSGEEPCCGGFCGLVLSHGGEAAKCKPGLRSELAVAAMTGSRMLLAQARNTGEGRRR